MSDTRTDWKAVAQELGPEFAARAAAHDAEDSFVADNYGRLRERKLFSSGVAAELGGGGASHPELCAVLREIGRHCGSTALALSMHTHLVAAAMWRFRHGDKGAEPLLRRVAAEELVLVSTGGSDWIDGSGKAEKVDGGYRITARKVFGSGSPAGDLLLTTAIHEDPQAGPTVLHFALPMKGPGIKVLDNWRTLGMRATGSNDVLIDGVTVPESAIVLRRPAGKWHRFWDVLSPVAWPLVTSVYVGVADAARAIALAQAARRRDDVVTQLLVGEMETQHAATDLALEGLIRLANDYDFEPTLERSNRAYQYKSLLTHSALATVTKAVEAAGGSSFFRSVGLERLFRDIQGVRFHPFQDKRQHLFAGRVALGLDPV